MRTPKGLKKLSFILIALFTVGALQLMAHHSFAMFDTTNKDRFVAWLVTKLLPRLKRGDILLMDNLGAHKGPRVDFWCKHFGVRLMYLPPYSHDLNPIEPAWALQKQHVRKHAPRTSTDLASVGHQAMFDGRTV